MRVTPVIEVGAPRPDGPDPGVDGARPWHRILSPSHRSGSSGPSRAPQLPQGERLQKVLAATGWGSRRVCEDLIAAGRVTVNGEVAMLGRRVEVDHDRVEVDGVPIGVKPGLVYYLVNKPRGVVTTSKDTHGRPTVIELVPPNRGCSRSGGSTPTPRACCC